MEVKNCKIELFDETNVVYYDTRGIARKGTIRFDSITKQLLSRFNFWVSKDKLNEREDLQLLGLYLYNLLLPLESNLRQEFESDYDSVMRSSNDRMRLTLAFHEKAGELANYPWEFLYLPDRKMPNLPKREGGFIAGQKTKLILTRFMPDVEHKLGVREKELRILVVCSYPYDPDLDDIDTDDTTKAIETIEKLTRPPSVQVRILRTPTYAEFKDAMYKPAKPDEEPFRPHIVHFIGHGDKAKGLALKMNKEEIEERKSKKQDRKETAWCDSQTICDLFSDPPPRLVFLHACEGARPNTLEGFSDLARDLAKMKMPAVVAMQYKIKTGDAATFASVFYEKIGCGLDVDEAVRAGREALGNPRYGGQGSWSDRRFGTPVVYLQSEDPIVSVPREAITKQTSVVSPGPSPELPSCTCPHCGGTAQKYCQRCFLKVRCVCGAVYPNPLEPGCGMCTEPIIQDKWKREVPGKLGGLMATTHIPATDKSSFDEDRISKVKLG